MSHLVAAPDKFRGTATAAEVAAAVGGAARRAGWTADEIPMSDGGEGLLLAVGGTPHHAWVPGPLGVPTEAEWRLLPADGSGGTRRYNCGDRDVPGRRPRAAPPSPW